jgi:hypothetical protein
MGQLVDILNEIQVREATLRKLADSEHSLRAVLTVRCSSFFAASSFMSDLSRHIAKYRTSVRTIISFHVFAPGYDPGT